LPRGVEGEEVPEGDWIELDVGTMEPRETGGVSFLGGGGGMLLKYPGDADRN